MKKDFDYLKNMSSTMNKPQTQENLLCIIIMQPISIFTKVKREVLGVLVYCFCFGRRLGVEIALRGKWLFYNCEIIFFLT